MKTENYNVVGVMSGTSLDGVDLAHILLTLHEGNWTYTIKEAETVAYDEPWVQTLKTAVDYNEQELAQLNHDYTHLLGSIINNFIAKHHLKGIDAVCSHGHTVLHQPHKGITLQIGNLPQIALTGQKVVCDFRTDDVMLGGQGAPLVPVGDKLLFAGYDYCLNLGGFSNISFDENGNRIAYDICPVNTVLNFYAQSLGKEYDAGGSIAATGSLMPEVLEHLNGLEFYNAPYPKSLGFEFVKTTVLPFMEKYDAPAKDKLRTFAEHIAIQIAKAIKIKTARTSLLITGGGAYNTFLIDRLRAWLPDTAINIPDDKTIQYKEALIFALLGVLKLRNDINVLASVTGASKNHSSGKIYLP